jgi:glycosyltransferase involved in cell wall biosynthesis
MSISFESAIKCIEEQKWEEACTAFSAILDSDESNDNKYISCIKLFESYKQLNNIEKGISYLIQSHHYDHNRVEGIYHLIMHYVSHGQPHIALGFYRWIQQTYEQDTINDLLDYDQSIYLFYLPYYMIIVSEQTKHYEIGIKMYDIIFQKKYSSVPTFYIGCLLHNFRFFIDHIPKPNPNFTDHFIQYLNMIHSTTLKIDDTQSIKQYINSLDPSKIDSVKVLSEPYIREQCKQSKKILFYCGFSSSPWNHTTMMNHGVGGSETCVAKLAMQFPNNYEIFVCGGVASETVKNVTYVDFHRLPDLLKTNQFYAVIVSRYIGFLEDYTFSTYKLLIWIHDLDFIPYAWGRNVVKSDVLQKWNSQIDHYVCLTEWHRKHMESYYPFISDKTIILSNGITSSLFTPQSEKKKNRFVFTSCPERGYTRVLELWPEITKQLPDAELKLATYVKYPRNDEEIEQMKYIKSCPNIEFLGCLKPSELYALMASSEYWFYPTGFHETFCITAVEMLHSNVICLYYPVAALQNTVGEYGISISHGSDLDAIISIASDPERKQKMMERGLAYAQSFDWPSVYQKWSTVLFSKTNARLQLAAFNGFHFHYEMFGYLINYCKYTQHDLTIYCHIEKSQGFIDIYKKTFSDVSITFKNVHEFESEKYKFDAIILITDDDYSFHTNDPIINKKTLCIDHYYKIRRPEIETRIGTRPFNKEYTHNWALPIYPIHSDITATSHSSDEVHILLIGGDIRTDFNVSILNRLQVHSHQSIHLHIVRRVIYPSQFEKVDSRITLIFHSNISTDDMFALCKSCDYAITDVSSSTDYEDKSMSGSVPLYFSLLVPLIISKQSNQYYQFQNVIEFDKNLNDEIVLKEIDPILLEKERQGLIQHGFDALNECIRHLA